MFHENLSLCFQETDERVRQRVAVLLVNYQSLHVKTLWPRLGKNPAPEVSVDMLGCNMDPPSWFSQRSLRTVTMMSCAACFTACDVGHVALSLATCLLSAVTAKVANPRPSMVLWTSSVSLTLSFLNNQRRRSKSVATHFHAELPQTVLGSLVLVLILCLCGCMSIHESKAKHLTRPLVAGCSSTIPAASMLADGPN